MINEGVSEKCFEENQRLTSGKKMWYDNNNHVQKKGDKRMSMLQSVIMGLIQGLTEFLPVSSSGHLALLNII